MKELHIDIETYSSADLAKCGVYKYTESPDFEILLFGYSCDGGEVRVVDLACGEKLPKEILAALEDESVTKLAHNASFERVCLSRYLGYPTGEYLNPEEWKCTMVWSAYMGLPLSLAGVGAVLGLDKQKMGEGKDLIRYFCVPCAPTKTNGGRTRNLPSDAPDKWDVFKKYNVRDVEVEMQIQQKLERFPVPDSVWEEYAIDQEINDRGVRIDGVLVQNAIAMDTEIKEELKTKMQELTALENPNSVSQLSGWLADNGVETDSLGKKQVKALMEEVPEEIREVLRLRQQLAKSSVKKYQAMKNAACSDGRARGMFMFYGANRTGRFSGRLIQMQNLPQNHLPDLAEARALVRQGNLEAVKMLYEDVPDTLSQLIRTAFIPREGARFYVADFSAIEARVLSWIAGEEWRMEVFASGGDIYCATASRMFGVPVVKHGENGELRQKGKQVELSCIAEGSLVLTDRGLVPIEKVKQEDKVWDGEEWVSHDGVIYRGEREVITYEGLTATPDHFVWVEGKSEPVQLGFAATCGAHLVQTGDGGRALRLGKNYQSGEAMERKAESLLCSDTVHGLRCDTVAAQDKSDQWKIERVPELYSETSHSELAGKETGSSQAEMRESKRCRVCQLRCERDKVRVSQCDRSRTLSDQAVRTSKTGDGTGPDRQQRQLCPWEYSSGNKTGEFCKSKDNGTRQIRAEVLAVLPECCCPETEQWDEPGRNHSGCTDCGIREKEELANYKRTARLYDIRNAGRHHRFTVSGHLVHNCGYGGSVGALKAMGALELGMKEEELKPLVDSWRSANPNIVRLWGEIERAAIHVIKTKEPQQVKCLRFTYQSGFLFIYLPSGRKLAYVKPRLGENQFGGTSITYEGVGGTKKWERLESFGGKLTENVIQAISRDILCYAMRTLRCCSIVMHVHDELIIEADPRVSLEAICEQMGRTPPWTPGLVLRADGFTSDFYMKD
jgi:DNA polymerase